MTPSSLAFRAILGKDLRTELRTLIEKGEPEVLDRDPSTLVTHVRKRLSE